MIELNQMNFDNDKVDLMLYQRELSMTKKRRIKKIYNRIVKIYKYTSIEESNWIINALKIQEEQ